jgi:hypothetical protein
MCVIYVLPSKSGMAFHKPTKQMENLLSEISGSHGSKNEDGCLLGCCAV